MGGWSSRNSASIRLFHPCKGLVNERQNCGTLTSVLMSETYPPDVREFMRQQLESGEYRSQEELFVAALRALRVVADHHHLLRADIHPGPLGFYWG